MFPVATVHKLVQCAHRGAPLVVFIADNTKKVTGTPKW